MKKFLTLLLTLVSAQAFAQDTILPSTGKPTVYIGGVPVMTNDQLEHSTFDEDMPEELRNNAARMAIQNRKEMSIYIHAPVKNHMENSPITILEFADLSCLQCFETFKQVDAYLKPYEEKNLVQRIYVHAPIDPYNATSPAAFYARIAHHEDMFWQYRDMLINADIDTENLFAQKVTELGIEKKSLRDIIRDKSRKFYAEIDADVELAHKLSNNGATYYVNGIRLGQNIPLAQMPQLLEYELKLYNRKQ